jgi:hypothetical protein
MLTLPPAHGQIASDGRIHLDAILDDVKGVTSTVREETGRMQDLMDWILEAFSRKRGRAHDKPSSRVM